jgi:hypothetical protein
MMAGAAAVFVCLKTRSGGARQARVAKMAVGDFFFGRSPVFSENIGTFYIANGMMYPSFVTAFAFDFSWGAARSDCSSPNVRRIQQNKIQQVFLGPLSVAAHKSGPLMRPLADKKC